MVLDVLYAIGMSFTIILKGRSRATHLARDINRDIVQISSFSFPIQITITGSFGPLRETVTQHLPGTLCRLRSCNCRISVASSALVVAKRPWAKRAPTKNYCRGTCKSCRADISPTLARMSANYLEKNGQAIAICAATDPLALTMLKTFNGAVFS